jgi:hypothetical protein
MPAIICYVRLGDDGREVQLRVRFSQRVAVPIYDVPFPEPPRRLLLICPGFAADLRYTSTAFNFAVYYISSTDFDMLLDLIRRSCSLEPCRLPCVLTTPDPT